MKSIYILFIIALLAISNSSFAQYAKDAIRYSTSQTGSTSRIKGIGNASTAIGGDLTSISANPAGLGYFTKSEASITPEFDSYSNSSAYLGQATTATKTNPNLNNVAIVLYTRLNTASGQDKGKGWLSLNWGASYNRTNNFDEHIQYSGQNTGNSINDYYAKLANSFGTDYNELQTWALSQKLISKYGTPANYTYAANSFEGVSQANDINRTGGQNALNLSVGTNYSNKLYLGFGVGITNLRYKFTNTFTETGSLSVSENNLPVTRSYSSTYTRYQETNGEGFDARFGVIYKPVEFIRLGATVTSPMFITVNDSSNEGLKSSINANGNYANGPVEYPLTYNMHTPFKTSGGVAIFLGKYGFITGDVEYIDYSTASMSSNEDYDNAYDNGLIKSDYKSAINLHTGAEFKLGPLALRGGYGILGSPLKANGVSTKMVTGGLGYRLGSYYVDAAVMHITGSQSIMPYDIGATTPVANVNSTNNNVYVTFGYRY